MARYSLISTSTPVCSMLVALAAAWGAEPEVAARVDGRPIYASEVERLVRESSKERQVSDAARAALAKQALEQLISRQLILARLAREDAGATAEEVERAVKALESRAGQDKQPFDQWLKQNGFTLDTLRDEVTWRIAWRRYLEKHVTGAALEQHFQKHRRHFDGSEIRVAHILWKLAPERDAASEQRVITQARQVRDEIVAGRLKFAQAAQQHSSAPSRDEGGDIGFIPRHGVMDEAFARAAFDLGSGQVSQPVLSSFGVHLIRCLEIRAGTKAASDCREELRLAVSQELFERLAAEERRGAKEERVTR